MGQADIRREKIFRFIDDHADVSMATLRRFCRQPRISSEGVGIREMAAIMDEFAK
jgi:hypothetical protein